MSADRKMHVALVGPVDAPGVADLVYPSQQQRLIGEPQSNGTAPGRVARALIQAGHHVSMVTHQRGKDALRACGENFEYIRVSSRSNRLSQVGSRWRRETKAMAEVITGLRPDVVHSNWTYEAALACIESGLPHVATIRDAPLTVVKFDPRPTRVVRLTMATEFRLRSSRAVLTAVSPYMASAWRRQMLDRRVVHIVPNPIDLPRLEELPPKSDFPLLVEIADSGDRKNVKRLLQAFCLIRARLPESQLHLVGHGLDAGGELQHWAEENRCVAGVHFRGVLPATQTRGLLRRAWAHPHAALEESFGNTLVESMSVGTAVVGGSSSGAVPWVLGNGRAGRLVDVSSARAFADGLIAVLDDGALRERLEVEGRAYAASAYSSAAIAKQYRDAYVRAIAGAS